ncbi:hypothetical protein [Aurantibacter aestuarii]|uniref:Uncharacterized protein n=1 Tax=Aurantibacter aestuarii TaxID=1266046 RepID=A0A2T1ND69_9FLAO|nr:hypothetical protein [Aurantibacter aestuarii]PSG90374.1 hypothetical protein C7H52_03590 [Aurantibacter aestuarii]
MISLKETLIYILFLFVAMSCSHREKLIGSYSVLTSENQYFEIVIQDNTYYQIDPDFLTTEKRKIFVSETNIILCDVDNSNKIEFTLQANKNGTYKFIYDSTQFWTLNKINDKYNYMDFLEDLDTLRFKSEFHLRKKQSSLR